MRLLTITIIVCIKCSSCKDCTPKQKTVAVIDNASGEYRYEPNVSIITGTITKMGVYGPPGFGEDTTIDKKDSAYIIVLDKKITVLADTSNIENTEATETGIDTIQLNTNPQQHILSYMRQKVELSGTFYHADNGNHYTPVLMTVNTIRRK